MMSFRERYAVYVQKLGDALKTHGLLVNSRQIGFSDSALNAAATGDWDNAVSELRDLLQGILGDRLSAHHQFLERPYVRHMQFPHGGHISIAIINNQSRDWYGTEHTIGSFDFLLEAQRGIFEECSRFLDLGGHQLIWACYYATLASDARVTSFEPSILNVAVGLFNCLVNNVIEKVDVNPFAVLASNAPTGTLDQEKMLVDFMTVPLRTLRLDESLVGLFDFIKVDIEGYEYELLNDPVFLDLMRQAKYSHLELHLGHLVGRGIYQDDWVRRLRAGNLGGTELYSQTEMFSFLETCDPKGFYSFIISEPQV